MDFLKQMAKSAMDTVEQAMAKEHEADMELEKWNDNITRLQGLGANLRKRFQAYAQAMVDAVCLRVWFVMCSAVLEACAVVANLYV
jgi:hypothetical protein